YKHLTLGLLLVGASFFNDGCSCDDEYQGMWEFEEYEDFDADPPKTELDLNDEEPDLEEDPDDWDWAYPDPDIEEDPPEWEETKWKEEMIDEGIPRYFASDD